MTLEVLEVDLCDILQCTLKLDSAALVSFIATNEGAHDLVTFTHQHPEANIKINVWSSSAKESADLVRANFSSSPQQRKYLKNHHFLGRVIDYLGGTSPVMSYISLSSSAFYPVTDPDTIVNLAELKAMGFRHFVNRQNSALYSSHLLPHPVTNKGPFTASLNCMTTMT